jgi:hypothetical protein
MKRVPRWSSEPQIVHLKTNTGDLQRFVLSPENFDPGVIGMIPHMEREAVHGYRLAVSRTAAGLEFWIIRDRDQTSLTHNDVYLGDWPPFLQLETTILAALEETSLPVVTCARKEEAFGGIAPRLEPTGPLPLNS